MNLRILAPLSLALLLTAACAEEPGLAPGAAPDAGLDGSELTTLYPAVYNSVTSHIRIQDTSDCLSVVGGSTSNGASTEWRTCSWDDDQEWRVEPWYGPDGKTYRIRNVESNKCLDAYSSGLTIYTCLDDDWQRWDAIGLSVEWARLENDRTGKVLAGPASTGGWWVTLDPADYATSHTISSLDDCWDVPSSSLTTTFVKWYSCHGGTNQQVRIVPTTVGGDEYTLRMKHSGLCLQDWPGNHVVQTSCSGSATQRWSVHYAWEYGYYFIIRDGDWNREIGLATTGYLDVAPHWNGRWVIEPI